ncbi:hypothetical protein WJX74_004604 [Apatococcus lobatus]|uniref:cyclin-dependent kinase n=1 Tax=Apatococcus lobatus TaxID=904363 RepID=A0AAW1S7B8_9CHLO
MEAYQVVSEVGEGTYGVVLKCVHRQTGNVVAVKKFKETEEDDQVRKTSRREVALLRRLQHPNVIELLDGFYHDGKLCLVFDFVPQTLLDCLKRAPGGLAQHTVRHLIWQLLVALDYLHAQKVMHRDVKPENILISEEQTMRLCDFGFARSTDLAAEEEDEAGFSSYVATRWYRSPELLVSAEYGPPVDVWAVGCLVYEMLTGLPLFPGKTDVDQLNLVAKALGSLLPKHTQALRRQVLQLSMSDRGCLSSGPVLHTQLQGLDSHTSAFIKACLNPDPVKRKTCAELKGMAYMAEERKAAEAEAAAEAAEQMLQAKQGESVPASEPLRKTRSLKRKNAGGLPDELAELQSVLAEQQQQSFQADWKIPAGNTLPILGHTNDASQPQSHSSLAAPPPLAQPPPSEPSTLQTPDSPMQVAAGHSEVLQPASCSYTTWGHQHEHFLGQSGYQQNSGAEISPQFGCTGSTHSALDSPPAAVTGSGEKLSPQQEAYMAWRSLPEDAPAHFEGNLGIHGPPGSLLHADSLMDVAPRDSPSLSQQMRRASLGWDPCVPMQLQAGWHDGWVGDGSPDRTPQQLPGQQLWVGRPLEPVDASHIAAAAVQTHPIFSGAGVGLQPDGSDGDGFPAAGFQIPPTWNADAEGPYRFGAPLQIPPDVPFEMHRLQLGPPHAEGPLATSSACLVSEPQADALSATSMNPMALDSLELFQLPHGTTDLGTSMSHCGDPSGSRELLEAAVQAPWQIKAMYPCNGNTQWQGSAGAKPVSPQLRNHSDPSLQQLSTMNHEARAGHLMVAQEAHQQDHQHCSSSMPGSVAMSEPSMQTFYNPSHAAMPDPPGLPLENALRNAVNSTHPHGAGGSGGSSVESPTPTGGGQNYGADPMSGVGVIPDPASPVQPPGGLLWACWPFPEALAPITGWQASPSGKPQDFRKGASRHGDAGLNEAGAEPLLPEHGSGSGVRRALGALQSLSGCQALMRPLLGLANPAEACPEQPPSTWGVGSFPLSFCLPKQQQTTNTDYCSSQAEPDTPQRRRPPPHELAPLMNPTPGRQHVHRNLFESQQWQAAPHARPQDQPMSHHLTATSELPFCRTSEASQTGVWSQALVPEQLAGQAEPVGNPGKWELWTNDKDGATETGKGIGTPAAHAHDFLPTDQANQATDRKLVVQDWQPDSTQTCVNEAHALSNGLHQRQNSGHRYWDEGLH